MTTSNSSETPTKYSQRTLADMILSINNRNALIDALFYITHETLNDLTYSMVHLKREYDEIIEQNKKNEKEEKLKQNKESKYQKILRKLYELKCLPYCPEISLFRNVNSVKEFLNIVDGVSDFDVSINLDLHNTILKLESDFVSVPLYGAELRGSFYNYLIANGESVDSISKAYNISIRHINNYIRFCEFITHNPYFLKINLSFSFVKENFVTIKDILKSNIELDELCKLPFKIVCS